MNQFWALGLTMLLAMPVGSVNAHQVLSVPRQRIEAADFRVSGHLVRVSADGVRSTCTLSLKARWFPGVLRILVELGQPSRAGRDQREHILLEMRPNGRNTIAIAYPSEVSPITIPFEKWQETPIGPGLGLEDLLEQQYFWPSQTVVEGVRRGARDCDLVTSKPGPTDQTAYAEVKTWLDHGIGFPVYVEKTLKATGAVEEFTYLGLRHDEGVWSARQIEAKTRGQEGSTLMIIDRGNAKANLSLKDFSREQLMSFE